MKITIIDNETKHIPDIKKNFPNSEIDVFQYNQNYNIKNSDLIILSWWSHHSIFYKNHPYKKELQLIKNTDIPIIWICLWCQLIAQAYNSSFWKLSDKIIKIIQITNTKTKKTKTVFEAHRYYIKNLWTPLNGIYKSEFWREMIKHKNKKIRWLQFHPEITKPDNDGNKLLQEIINKISTQ